jgi:hypothetical protein
MKFEDKRLAEIMAEVKILTDAVRKESDARLAFDDDPAAFASVMAQASNAEEKAK